MMHAFRKLFFRLLSHISKHILHLLPPESSHALAMWGLRQDLMPDLRGHCDKCLFQNILNRDFPNPIGLAAGFDKNARVMRPLFKMGFGFVEVGTVTLFPQVGNLKPRLFRLRQHKALINRMGLNNVGVEAFSSNIESYHLHQDEGRPLGINFGYKAGPDNLTAREHLDKITSQIAKFKEYGDYFIWNISCPNVKGGRDKQFSDELLGDLKAIRDNLGDDATLLVKLAPDLTEETLNHLLNTLKNCAVNGLILTNTLPNTPETTWVDGQHSNETGGLSGAPLKEISTNLIRLTYQLTEGKLPIIGVGGVSNGADAYEKIRAGASLIQIYTGFIYEGPWIVERIKQELTQLLHEDGYASITDAVGADHHQSNNLKTAKS